MKKSDLKRILDFHEKVTMQQIIDPVMINEILLLVNPDANTQRPYLQKQREITVFVQGMKQEVLNDLEDLFEESDKQLAEENDPRSPNYQPAKSEDMKVEEQSHSEDADSELMKLEQQYAEATEANEKRSLKMRINKLKKG